MPSLRLRDDSLPPALTGPLLVDAAGLPRYWSTVYIAVDGGGRSDSTNSGELAAIERFYQSVLRQRGRDCLDQLIRDLNFDALEAALEGFFTELRNGWLTQEQNRSRAWRSVVLFVRACCERLARTAPRREFHGRLERHLRRLDRLFAELRPGRRPQAPGPRALPAGALEDLYEVASPESARNPFRNEMLRWRNFVLFLLTLHQGLRRSEALILPVDALKSGLDARTHELRFWLNVAANPYEGIDPRAAPPSLKTVHATRQLPVAEHLAGAVQTYIDNFRGRQNHSFLFSSQWNKPLSLRCVAKVFQSLSRALSPAARKELWDRRRKDVVTDHDLRHTCAVVRLRQLIALGVEDEVAMQTLRAFFGWSRTSDMPRHYARVYFEDRLATVWNSAFDSRVEVLRNARERS